MEVSAFSTPHCSDVDSPYSNVEFEQNITHYTDEDTDDEQLASTQPVQILKDVVAYVEVRSRNDNRSKAICNELQQLGATIAGKFTDDVTHVVFKEGSKRTQTKAKKKGIHLVSVLWVDSCKKNQEHVSERLFPPNTNENQGTPVFVGKLKKAKSMQPKDFYEDLADSAERCRIKRKRIATMNRFKSVEGTPVNSPLILAPETQPRSPSEESILFTPQSFTVPDTPPSMRAKMQKLLKSIESPTGRDQHSPQSTEEPLQRRLFASILNAQKENIEPEEEDPLKDLENENDNGDRKDNKIEKEFSPQEKNLNDNAHKRRKLLSNNLDPQSFLIEPLSDKKSKRRPGLFDEHNLNPSKQKTKGKGKRKRKLSSSTDEETRARQKSEVEIDKNSPDVNSSSNFDDSISPVVNGTDATKVADDEGDKDFAENFKTRKPRKVRKSGVKSADCSLEKARPKRIANRRKSENVQLISAKSPEISDVKNSIERVAVSVCSDVQVSKSTRQKTPEIKIGTMPRSVTPSELTTPSNMRTIPKDSENTSEQNLIVTSSSGTTSGLNNVISVRQDKCKIISSAEREQTSINKTVGSKTRRRSSVRKKTHPMSVEVSSKCNSPTEINELTNNETGTETLVPEQSEHSTSQFGLEQSGHLHGQTVLEQSVQSSVVALQTGASVEEPAEKSKSKTRRKSSNQKQPEPDSTSALQESVATGSKSVSPISVPDYNVSKVGRRRKSDTSIKQKKIDDEKLAPRAVSSLSPNVKTRRRSVAVVSQQNSMQDEAMKSQAQVRVSKRRKSFSGGSTLVSPDVIQALNKSPCNGKRNVKQSDDACSPQHKVNNQVLNEKAKKQKGQRGNSNISTNSSAHNKSVAFSTKTIKLFEKDAIIEKDVKGKKSESHLNDETKHLESTATDVFAYTDCDTNIQTLSLGNSLYEKRKSNRKVSPKCKNSVESHIIPCASNGSAVDHKKEKSADVSSPTSEIQDTHQEATSTVQHTKEKESQNSTDKNSLQSPQADVTEIPSPSDITNIVTVKPLRKSRRSSVQNARRSLNKSIGDVDLKYTADQGSSSSWIVTPVEISNDKPGKISPHGQKCVDSNLPHNNNSKENTKSTQQSQKSTDNQTFLEDSTLSQTSELSTVSTLSSSMSVMYDGMGPSFLNETKSRPSIFEFKPQKPKKKKPKKTYQPNVKSSEDDDSGRSDGPSSDGSSRPEEKRKNNRKLSKADSSSSSVLSRHNRPSLVMTSLHSSEQEIVFSIVKTLGGFVITDNVLESTTHVIVGEPRRTLNVITAISQGCWLLTQDWVMQSLDAGSWLPEEGFECVDHFPAARTARLERLTASEPFKQSIFSSVGPIFISQKIVPPREKLTNLVKACGGQITTSLDNAQIYVGTDYYPDIHCLKSIWILDCITNHSQLGFTNYLLGRPKQAESPEF